MRLSDDRYARERSQFELALRMIGLEARTRTIRDCTGLSDDRIRKLYGTYFRDAGGVRVRRRRGKSPRRVTLFVKNPAYQLQATTLVALYCAGLLLRMDASGKLEMRWPRPGVEFGHRVCRAYEHYLQLHEQPLIAFEWAWNLLQNIGWHDELYLARCNTCHSRYVQDAFALDTRTCPACAIAAHRQRKPGVKSFSAR